MSNRAEGGSVTRAPQHIYILPWARGGVVSILCSFKLNISQSFGVGSYMDIRTGTRARTRARTHVYHRAGRVINLVGGGSGHKTDTIRTFVQNSTNSNTGKFESVISCRIVSKKLNSTIAVILIYYTRQP